VFAVAHPPLAVLRWHDYRRIGGVKRPHPLLWSWIIRDGSLTNALIELSHNHLTVDVLYQGYAKPRVDEYRLLNLKREQLCLVREVILKGEGKPWIFARSLIPVTHINADIRRLRKQGQTPLGRFLFQHRQLSRTPFQIAKVTANAHYAPKRLLGNMPAFARRSVFFVNGQSILVSEVYLPALEEKLCSPAHTPHPTKKSL
jgi:chorismate--pyruvate lyase